MGELSRVPPGTLPGRVPWASSAWFLAQNPKIQKIALALLVVKNCFGALSCQKSAFMRVRGDCRTQGCTCACCSLDPVCCIGPALCARSSCMQAAGRKSSNGVEKSTIAPSRSSSVKSVMRRGTSSCGGAVRTGTLRLHFFCV